jgi:hypothetical protein
LIPICRVAQQLPKARNIEIDRVRESETPFLGPPTNDLAAAAAAAINDAPFVDRAPLQHQRGIILQRLSALAGLTRRLRDTAETYPSCCEFKKKKA